MLVHDRVAAPDKERRAASRCTAGLLLSTVSCCCNTGFSIGGIEGLVAPAGVIEGLGFRI